MLKRLLWFLQGKCTNCGGELDVWDAKRAWCSICGKKD